MKRNVTVTSWEPCRLWHRDELEIDGVKPQDAKATTIEPLESGLLILGGREFPSKGAIAPQACRWCWDWLKGQADAEDQSRGLSFINIFPADFIIMEIHTGKAEVRED